MPDSTPIKPRERDVIVQALRAGVVPKLGLQHIQVGRALGYWANRRWRCWDSVRYW
jgi:hypothetical protein